MSIPTKNGLPLSWASSSKIPPVTRQRNRSSPFPPDPLEKKIQLTVQDNGIGIPAYELSRVFDRGFTGRPGSNSSSRGGSTGMGLYLCKKLISLIFTATLLTDGSGLVISGIIRGRSMENASFDLYFGIECQRPEPGIMVGTSSPGSIIAVSLGLFFLIYAIYILLAYHSLKRNALP